MPGPWDVFSAASRRSNLPRLLCTVVLLAQLLPTGNVFAYTQDQTGRWTPRQAWEQTPIHMALLRGSGSPYHSQVLWWVGTGDENRDFFGGLWGWRPGADDTCLAYPPDSLLHPLPFDRPGTASIFCSGHSQLADGKLLVAGGTQPGTEFGIRLAYTFNPAAPDSNVAWTERDSMKLARWYPTATTLADGRVLLTSGSHYQHLEFFGGRKGTESSASADTVFRYGIGEGGVAESAVRPSAGVDWPTPREGLSAVYYAGGPTRMFGGRLANGDYTDQVWQLRREPNPDGADYSYKMERVTPSTGPVARWRHVAVATRSPAAPMIAFGGIRNHLGQDEATDDVWRYWFNPDTLSPDYGYDWSEVAVTNPNSSDAPGPRCGHAALWHEPSRSMLVFGGRGSPTATPIDSFIYQLSFSDNSMTTATWHKLSATGPSPRAEMAVAYDSTYKDIPYTCAFVFGGELASGKSGQLWRLRLGDNPATGAIWEQISNLGGSYPTERSSPTMVVDGGNHLLYLYGGTPASGGPDKTVYVAHLDSLKEVVFGETRQWTPYAEASVALTGHIMVFEDGAIYARKPELYSPSDNTWSTLNAPRLQEWYPQTFVLRPDTVFVSGPDIHGRKLCLSTGNWSIFPPDSTIDFKGGGAVMYRPGKVMKAGSRDTDGGDGAMAVGTTRSVDLNSSIAHWAASSNDMTPRVNHNLVLLPNGGVLAVGGTSKLGNRANRDSVTNPEIWDPTYDSNAGQWSGLNVLAAQPTMRDYHSTALLLPDGRVLCGGGSSNPTLQSSAEIYCPPYLFNGDLRATRPTLIGSTGRWRYNTSVTFSVSGDTNIRLVCLIHPGAVTHAQDQAQRFVPLTLTTSTARNDGVRQYFVNSPTDSAVAPPGDYLLFVSDGAGVPSIARWVRVGNQQGGQYDGGGPNALESLAAEIITCESIEAIGWTTTGDDGNTGTAMAYDMRYSLSPINSGNFGSATPISAPAPLLAGTYQSGPGVSGLSRGTTVYVGAAVGDKAGNWSSLATASFATLSSSQVCDGGGGGYGEYMRRPGGTPTSVSPAAAAIGPSGRSREFSTPASLASENPTLRLVGDFTAEETSRWRIGYRDFAADTAVLGATSAQVMIQDGGAPGEWSTRSAQTLPGGTAGVRSLARTGRVIFPLGATLEGVELDPRAYALESAEHSRLGDLRDTSATEVAPEFTATDTIGLAYHAASTAGAGEDCAFRVWIPGSGGTTLRRVGPPRLPGEDLPVAFALHPAHPNPFRNTLSMRFDLPKASEVRIEVFDVQGRHIADLVRGQLSAGRHSASWNGVSDGGTRAAAGVYLCRMTAGFFRTDQRLVLTP